MQGKLNIMDDYSKKSDKLWHKANQLIPNGNSLLSKQKTLFLPQGWPTYFSKTNGLQVWDLEGVQYTDFIMSVGTNTLGYNNHHVNEKVKAVVSEGVMSTLNCPEEVYLAERLVDLHPWADMVKFARTGGEANAIAVRIARAATGRNHVAICGYHGWHDWYLAANLRADSLDQHLIPGLKANGVNTELKGTTHSFHYNDFGALEKIIATNDLAAVVMEVERSSPPQNGFLEKVRKICSEKNIVLIFDECTSGFRETFGGLHLKYGVYPDIAMFGKALGNGYAINSVLGRREIMEHAKESFISSTNWTERIGPTAALATLEQMEELKSWELLVENGNYFRNGLREFLNSRKMDVQFTGLIPLSVTQIICNFISQSEEVAFRTLITKRFLEYNILSYNLFYLSVLHTPSLLDRYLHIYSIIIDDIIDKINSGLSIEQQLGGDPAHLTFGRLS